MTRRQTRTFGGGYQNPSEGIIDFTAFGRGLQAGIQPGISYLKQKEAEAKLPQQYNTLGDIEILGAENKIGTLGIDSSTASNIEDSVKAVIQKELQPNYIISQNKANPNLQLQRKTEKEFLEIANGVKGYQLLASSFLNAEEAVDMRQDMIVGRNKKGDILTLGEFVSLDFQKQIGNNYKLERRNVDGKQQIGINAGGFFVRTDNINENNIGKYTPLKSNSDAFVADAYKGVGKTIKIQTVTEKKSVEEIIDGKKITTSEDTQIIKDDSYLAIDNTAVEVGQNFVDGNRATFKATYMDAILGENQLNNPKAYLRGFGETFEHGGVSYPINKFYEFNQDTQTMGNVPDDVKKALVSKYVADKYKARFSQAYNKNEFGHAVKTSDLTKKSVAVKETKPSVVGDARFAAERIQNPGAPIKDMTPASVKSFINLIGDATRGAQAFTKEDGKEFYEQSLINTINPTTENPYTRKEAQEMWNLTMKKYPNSGLIYVNNKQELVGIDIRTQESIAALVADVYGYKGSDKRIFIENYSNKPSLP